MQINMIFLSNYRLVIKPSDIKKKDNILSILEINQQKEFTHYMICEMNRLRIKQESIFYRENNIYFSVFEQRNEFDWYEHTFGIPAEHKTGLLKMSVEDNKIKLYNDFGELSFYSVIQFLEHLNQVLAFNDDLKRILSLNVRYIGQTELNLKYIRFDGHEKILEVTSEIIDNKPNKEAWIILFNFNIPICNSFIGSGIEGNFRNDWLPDGTLINDLPKKDWKNIVEGALINYYQPKLNRHFKDNFPSNTHISYKYFYNKDIRSIIVELKGEYSSYFLGNEEVKYTQSTLIQYSLKSIDNNVFLLDNNEQNIDTLIKVLGD